MSKKIRAEGVQQTHKIYPFSANVLDKDRKYAILIVNRIHILESGSLATSKTQKQTSCLCLKYVFSHFIHQP